MFEPEYVALVIKPKIDLVLEDGVGSIAELTARFNKTFECKVSKTRITDWLKSIGYRVTRTVHIDRPQKTVARQVREPAMAEEFQTMHRQPQFNFAPPSGMFVNVPMPGFQE